MDKSVGDIKTVFKRIQHIPWLNHLLILHRYYQHILSKNVTCSRSAWVPKTSQVNAGCPGARQSTGVLNQPRTMQILKVQHAISEDLVLDVLVRHSPTHLVSHGRTMPCFIDVLLHNVFPNCYFFIYKLRFGYCVLQQWVDRWYSPTKSILYGRFSTVLKQEQLS